MPDPSALHDAPAPPSAPDLSSTNGPASAAESEGSPPRRRVPRIGRALDLLGLLLFALGAGAYGWAWMGFGRVRDLQPSPDAAPWAAVRMANGYWRLQKVGVTLMLVGIAVFVAAWWAARRAGRRAERAEDATA